MSIEHRTRRQPTPTTRVLPHGPAANMKFFGPRGKTPQLGISPGGRRYGLIPVKITTVETDDPFLLISGTPPSPSSPVENIWCTNSQEMRPRKSSKKPPHCKVKNPSDMTTENRTKSVQATISAAEIRQVERKSTPIDATGSRTDNYLAFCFGTNGAAPFQEMASEWGHLHGDKTGGKNEVSNLVLISKAANFLMRPIDLAIVDFLKEHPEASIGYSATANLMRGKTDKTEGQYVNCALSISICLTPSCGNRLSADTVFIEITDAATNNRGAKDYLSTTQNDIHAKLNRLWENMLQQPSQTIQPERYTL